MLNSTERSIIEIRRNEEKTTERRGETGFGTME